MLEAYENKIVNNDKKIKSMNECREFYESHYIFFDFLEGNKIYEVILANFLNIYHLLSFLLNNINTIIANIINCFCSLTGFIYIIINKFRDFKILILCFLLIVFLFLRIYCSENFFIYFLMNISLT